MRVFNKPIILLNSAQAIIDLLEARSAIYSSRPHLTMACDLCVEISAMSLFF